MTTAPLIDLDASKRETQYPNGIPVVKKGMTFILPAELPAEVLDPFLSEDLDLIGLVKVLFEEDETGAAGDDGASVTDSILDKLLDRPTLPKDLLDALYAALELLFDSESDGNFQRFKDLKPSIPDYLRLVKALANTYGVSLGEAFASDGSSVPAGPTPSPTSPSTAESTPETSGDAPETPAS